jgi:2-C-methyl-D-erythritol 4-phosphate cytidylyltransferase
VIAAVVTAAGSSVRMGGLKKEYRILGNDNLDRDGQPLTVLGAALSAFVDSGLVDLIVVSVPADGESAARAAIPASLLGLDAVPRVLFVPGGSTRRRSVHQALALLSAYGPDYVLIHDGARPWVDVGLIARTIAAVREKRAVVPVLPLVETPKEIDVSGFVVRHLRRAAVAAAQTPQAFAFPEILAAHEKAAERELAEDIEYTDDAEVWGAFVGPVAVVEGSAGNRKITFPGDLP